MIVDFCGGSGHVGLPLAVLLPHCKVVVADINQESLEIVRTRATAAGLTNLTTWSGDVAAFDVCFDIGVALHACGEATDLSLNACVAARASFVFSPCCVGKMRSSRMQWADKEHREAQTTAGSVEYPRSAAMRALLNVNSFDALATAGDYSDPLSLGTKRGAERYRKAALAHLCPSLAVLPQSLCVLSLYLCVVSLYFCVVSLSVCVLCDHGRAA